MSRLFAPTPTSGNHGLFARFGTRTSKVLATLVALLVAVLGVPAIVTTAAQASPARVTPADNPDLAAGCGLDVVLVLDASGSIGQSNATQNVKDAANTFLSSFADTNTRVGIVKFNTTATASVPLTTVTAASAAPSGVHGAAVASYTSSGRTNWQDAMVKAKSEFDSASARSVPKLIVFVTDGAPNTVNSGSGTTNVTEASAAAVDPAVTVMNSIKAEGVHSLVVGVGQALSSGGVSTLSDRLDALARMSQYPTPKSYPATAFDAATTDEILQPDYSGLEADLHTVASQICDGTLTVTKYASSADAPNTYTNAGSGWSFDTTVSPAGDWVKPSTGTGATQTAVTDATGTALFQWNVASNPSWTKSATVTDTGKTNYTPDHVTCTTNGGSPVSIPFTGTNQNQFPVTVGAGKQVACAVYNKYSGPANTDVGIAKSVSPSSVVVGGSTTWTLTASNNGPNTAHNVVYTDTLPTSGTGAPTSINASAGSAVYTAGSPGKIVWTIPTLAVGASPTLTFGTTVTTAGAHTNNVVLTSLTEHDTNDSNNSASATVTGTQADVTITKTPDVSSQVLDGNVVWTLTASNSGNADASNVKVVDTLPAGLAYVSDDSGGVYDATAGTVTWTLGTLAANGTKTIKLTTKGTATGDQKNCAAISTTTPESSTSNDTGCGTTTITVADLAVTKTASVHSAVLGDSVAWTIKVTNNGTATAKNVTVSDNVPAGLTVTSTVPANALVGNTWTVGDLAPGASATLVVNTTVNTVTGSITNKACASTTTTESNTANNCGQDTVNVSAADVSVTKVPDLTQVYIDGQVIWTITVSNTGAHDANNVVVTDTVPGNLTLGAAQPGSPSQGTFNPTTAVWTVGTVPGTVNAPPSGGSATLAVSSFVGNQLGVLTNTVNVTTTTPETDTTNNQGQGSTDVVAADVTITKTVDHHDVPLGGTSVWTVKVTNNGTGAASGVVVTDVIPAGLQVTNVVPTGALSGNTWNVGSLAANGGSATLTITTTATALGHIVNTATITASQHDTGAGQKSACDYIDVTAADLSVTKTADNDNPSLQGTVHWTVTVTNSGTADAQNVVVDDLAPAGLTVTAATPSQGSYNATTGVWTVGTVAKNGGTATLVVTTTVTKTGDITNKACVSSGTVDSNSANNCDQHTVHVHAPCVRITKTADTHDPNLQGEVKWTIVATNTGDADAANVVATDTIPAGLTVDNATPSQGSFDASTGVWTIGTLAKNGGSATLTLTTTVTQLGAITNTACVTTTSAEVYQGQSCGHDTVHVHAPCLTITKTADVHDANLQGQVTWTITATNNGDADAANVVATDTIPAGLTVDNATPSQGSFDASTGVWTIGTLAKNGGSATLTLTTTVTQLGAITNTVCVTTTTVQANSDKRCGSDTVHVHAPDVTITKTADVHDPNLQGQVTWTITATNNGDADAANVVATDTIPAGLTVDNATPSQGSFDASTGVWTIGTLAKNGGSATLTLTTTVTQLGAITNTVCVKTDTVESNTDNNCGSDTVHVHAPDVTVTKVADQHDVLLNGTVNWTIVATNNGDADAANVVVTDTVPAGLTINSYDAPAGTTFDPATGTWTIGTLAAGAHATLVLHTTAKATGSITNSVCVTTTTVESNTDNNCGSDTVKVHAADITMTKTADLHQQYLDGEVVWTITATNNGDADATNVVATDALPAGLQLVSDIPSAGTTYDPTTNVWTIGTLLKNGGTATLTLTTKAIATGDLTNTICATTDTPETDYTNNCGSDTTTITRDVKLSILKTQDASTPNPIQPNNPVKYDITMTNSGKSPANDVHFTDPLPAGMTFVSAAGTDWTCTDTSNTVNCTYGVDLAAGATTPPVVVTATVTDALLRAPDATNTACITPSSQPGTPTEVTQVENDQDATQCSSVVTTFPQGTLTVTKSNDPDANAVMSFGDTITYTLTVTATGDLVEHNVVVGDDIPGYGSNASSTPTTYVAGSATCVAPPTPTPANCTVTPTSTGGKVTSLAWSLGDMAGGTTRTVTFQVKIDVAPTNPEGNGDTVTVTNAGSVEATETPSTPSNTTTNTVHVVTLIPSTESSCVSDTPYFNFTSTGWFANETVHVHVLDKDGNPVLVNGQPDIRDIQADANGNITAHLLWPGFSIDPVTGVKTYPGLDVRPMQFYLEGSPRTSTETVAYPAASTKCDAALTVVKSNTPTGTVSIGDTIHYTLKVTAPANGSFDQDNVVVSDYIPGYDPNVTSATTAYISGSAGCTGTILPSVGKCDVTLTKNSSGTVTKITWALGSMKPGQVTNAVFAVKTLDQPNTDSDTATIYNVGAVRSDYWPETSSNEVKNTLDLTKVLGEKIPGNGSTPPSLAHTGFDLLGEFGIAMSMLIAGGFVLAVSRRRRYEQ